MVYQSAFKQLPSCLNLIMRSNRNRESTVRSQGRQAVLWQRGLGPASKFMSFGKQVDGDICPRIYGRPMNICIYHASTQQFVEQIGSHAQFLRQFKVDLAENSAPLHKPRTPTFLTLPCDVALKCVTIYIGSANLSSKLGYDYTDHKSFRSESAKVWLHLAGHWMVEYG
ncbi:hypothetical protein EJ05DRAFT_523442 [Pseudovirgaria hyperparasitica]|uniref:Uncharacterized protein n=1 Tax=Pseudovirgaria hyperparasitica TaxID=470096 RepID=A0A6A6VQW1_9PEZI|nr:uncharacterized protein EJ05DRAFT_523442 [Pseudovirgaria hyperparasitica]KAF2753048.1 hypothetical protein EJ05DRAFT_523442 [Pseudovirgaria hyperparasitica]